MPQSKMIQQFRTAVAVGTPGIYSITNKANKGNPNLITSLKGKTRSEDAKAKTSRSLKEAWEQNPERWPQGRKLGGKADA